MFKRDFIALNDYTKKELEKILDFAIKIKKNPIQSILSNKQLGMVFEKNSTRTRISFEVGIRQLGGDAIFLSSGDTQLSRGESISDTAKVMSRFLDLVMIRANSHEDVVEFAKYSSIPVINGLTDFNHPCQLMADLMTVMEAGKNLSDITVCWVGDGNNVCNSWLIAAHIFGFKMRLALKKDYYPDMALINKLQDLGLVEIFSDASEAALNSDVVTTDTWVSMGDSDPEARLSLFSDFQVTKEIMNNAKSDAIFLHCLPAHRGEEVAAEVIDGEQSLVFDEAENRLHAQKAIMCFLTDNIDE